MWILFSDSNIHIDWGSVPDWIVGAGTLLTVIVALAIARRDTVQNRKKDIVRHAESVAAWTESFGSTARVVISNDSKLPIFDVVVSYGAAYGAGRPYFTGNDDQQFALRIPPGIWTLTEPRNPSGGMHVQEGISISFEDSNGRYWRRDATGKLAQTQRHPFKELDISEPISGWDTPIRFDELTRV